MRPRRKCIDNDNVKGRKRVCCRENERDVLTEWNIRRSLASRGQVKATWELTDEQEAHSSRL